ncbi:protein kinase domain-containing protein [Nocardia thailandica]
MRDGDVFAGYLIERRLGRGGMGSVYLARHPRLPRRTALKVLDEELFADTELRARFEREADLVAQLDHPNIVTVYDRGADEGRLWISMQYIDGIDAATVDPAVLPPDRAVQIVGETAVALDFAHGRHVLHRDVKPANILLAKGTGGQERVYLTDFGIARLTDDPGRLTQTGSFTATIAYASPEQLTGAMMSGRSDQYSLACTLYWLLAGVAPFEAAGPAAVIQGHLQQPPPVLSRVRPGLPAALDDVLAQAMAKYPGERFATCAEFAAAARHALSGRSSGALPRVTVPSTDPAAAPAPSHSPAWQGAAAYPAMTPNAPARSGPGAPAPMAPAPVGAPYTPQAGHVPGGPAPRGYGHGRPRRRSTTGLVVGLCAALVVALAAGVGIWVAVSAVNAPPAQRDLDEMRQAFPGLLPSAEIPAGQTWGQGSGFGGMGCTGQVLTGRLTWIPDVHPDAGTPTAYWDCWYAGSYMFPATNTRWPSLRVFHYASAADAEQVVAGFTGGGRESLVSGGRTYTNYVWGTAPQTTPRMATVFPAGDRRHTMILYSTGYGASNDPSREQLIDWWKTLPLN